MTWGAGILAFGVFVGILYPADPSILFLGLVLGSLSALIAMGLVLVYRANRIVNFAQGDIGGVAGVLAASLIVGPKWGFWPSVIVGLLVAIALGAATEILVIRRFARAPRLVLTVATIGLAQLFQAVQLLLPQLFSYDTIPQPPRPFSFTFEWFPVVFNAGHLLIVSIVPFIALGLVLFFRRTRAGVAVRAAAESGDRASLLGVPVQRLNTLVWMLAGGLSGIAVLLRIPIQGVAIGTPLGPNLLLRALAAAVIGRMESLPRTVVAALVLGMVEQAVFYETHRTVIVDAVLFGVILGALLLQRRGHDDRAADTGASTWQALREVRPIPRELARLREVRLALAGGAVLACVALVVVPLGMSTSQVRLFGTGLILAMVMCSLVILTGWAGQISLGQLAIVAFGSAVGGTLSLQGKNFFVCLLAGGLAGAVVAIAIGVPALRIKGPFLAVTTLALAVAAGTYFLNPEFFGWLVPTQRPEDQIVRPVLFDKFDLATEHTYYFVVLVMLVLVIASVRRLQQSRTGRTLVSTRDNERAAQSYGISPTRAQLTAFGLSGFIAGFAGALYAFHETAVSSTLLVTDNNLKFFSIGVIGGLGSIPGALLAAGYLTFVDYSSFTSSPLSRLFASGVGVLAILLIKPGGLGGWLYQGRDALLRVVARRRGIVVPSLLADVRTDDEGETEAAAAPPRTSKPSDDPLLLVRGVEVAYGKSQVLFGVDFHVERGEIVALLGTNGAGKSTLLGAIAGLVAPSAGTVHYDGNDITGHAPVDTVSNGLVLMPGGKGVFPTLTVAENLALAAWLERDPAVRDAAIEEALAFFPILRDRCDERAGNLSGGEQQMLTLSQALICKPRLLMIDELSLGLAPVVVEQLLGIVRTIHERGTTVVLVEQSVNIAITLAQRAVFLEKGAVRFDGPTADLLDRPEILRAVFLRGATTTAPTTAANGDVPVRPAFVEHCESCGHTHALALEVTELSATFGGIRAVDDVGLRVHDGQVVGIIGPNGAGKTTVLDLISGFITPTRGRIQLGGTDVTELPPAGRAELGLGRSFQDARLFPSMTVRQTIATALERHVGVRDPIAAFVLSPAVTFAERAVNEEVDRLIELLSLQAFADKFVGELSTGTRRIVDLACTLAHQPTVLLLDEPSSGIAQRETEALGPVLLDIRDKTGAALIVIEHDMPLICSIADELVALELGSVVAHGSPADVINDPRVIEGYLGGDESVIFRSGKRKQGARRRGGPLVAARR
jgi:ABC-type branched-subunit amino acid transport system ATPase component/branched-subunit amino acid ABC-type transport system permease component